MDAVIMDMLSLEKTKLTMIIIRSQKYHRMTDMLLSLMEISKIELQKLKGQIFWYTVFKKEELWGTSPFIFWVRVLNRKNPGRVSLRTGKSMNSPKIFWVTGGVLQKFINYTLTALGKGEQK